MDGKALGEAMAGAALMVLGVGVAIGLVIAGLIWGGIWLFHHLSIVWN